MINWEDFNDLSSVVPLLARIYPNGSADVNHFHAAGGMGFLIRELLDAGLLHDDVLTVAGARACAATGRSPGWTTAGWSGATRRATAGDRRRAAAGRDPFSADGGLKLLTRQPRPRGDQDLGGQRTSTGWSKRRRGSSTTRKQVLAAFKAGELDRDVVVVVRFQGPRANGMPELHKLTPTLACCRIAGFHVALVTDGRMSGASGKVPAAIHVTPEAVCGGPLARVRDGDVIRLDSIAGTLELRATGDDWLRREPVRPDLQANGHGHGRELFALFRAAATDAESGARCG